MGLWEAGRSCELTTKGKLKAMGSPHYGAALMLTKSCRYMLMFGLARMLLRNGGGSQHDRLISLHLDTNRPLPPENSDRANFHHSSAYRQPQQTLRWPVWQRGARHECRPFFSSVYGGASGVAYGRGCAKRLILPRLQ